MSVAYSIDLRKKVVDAYERGDTSYSKVAENFGIHIRSVKRYVKQYREQGNLLPRKGNMGRPSKIDDPGYKLIQKLIRKDPTITLAKLSKLYYQEKQVSVGRSILSRACSKLNLRRKRLSRYAAEKDRSDIKKNGKTISS